MPYATLGTAPAWWAAAVHDPALAAGLLTRVPADAVAHAVTLHGATPLGGVVEVVAAADTALVVDALAGRSDTPPLTADEAAWLLEHADAGLGLLGRVPVPDAAVGEALAVLAARERWSDAAGLAGAPWCPWTVLLGFCADLADGQVAALLDADCDAPVLAALARSRPHDREVAAAVLGARGDGRPRSVQGPGRLSPLVGSDLAETVPALADDADLAFYVARAREKSEPLGSDPDPHDPQAVAAWLARVGGFLPPDRLVWVADAARAGTLEQVPAATWRCATRQVGPVWMRLADEVLLAGVCLPPSAALQAARPEWVLGRDGAARLLADGAAAEASLSSLQALAWRLGDRAVAALAGTLTPARAVALVADEAALGRWLAARPRRAGTVLALVDGWDGTLAQLDEAVATLQDPSGERGAHAAGARGCA